MAEQLDIENVRNEIAEKANEVVGQAVEFAKERPHVAVGIALGIGWVLGNGLPPRVILGAARLGWKAMLGGALASGGLANLFGGESSDDGASSSHGAVRTTAPRRAPSEAGARARHTSTANKD